MKKRAASRLTFIVLWMLAAGGQVWAQTTVCRLPAIPGFEALGNTGGRVVGSVTSDPKRLRIYVAAKGDVLYWHSNYSPTGSGKPVKIATSEKLPARELLAITLAPSLFLQEEPRYGGGKYDSRAALRDGLMSELKEVSRPDMLVEPDVLSNPRFSYLDLRSIGMVRVEAASTMWDGTLGTVVSLALGAVGLILVLAAGQLLFTWAPEWFATRFVKSSSEIDPSTHYLVITHLTTDQRNALAGAFQRSPGVEQAQVSSEDTSEYQQTVGLLTAARRDAFRQPDEQLSRISQDLKHDEYANSQAASPVEPSPRWEVHFAPDPVVQSSCISPERGPASPVDLSQVASRKVEPSRTPARKS
jgi:hypothetical protein